MGMEAKRTLRNVLTGVTLVGVAYACSGTPDAVLRPGNDDDGQAGEGAVSGRGGSSNGGTSIITPRGGRGGTSGGKGGSAAGNGEGGDGNGGFRDAGLPDVGFEYDASSGGEGGACAVVTGEATLVKRPMDIVIAIDNSASMQGEIQAVQARVNNDFAQIIGASGIDYRVIMVSRYGNVFTQNFGGGSPSDSAYSICIGSPLSSLNCPDNAGDTTPAVAHNPPRFYHHSTDIGSNNMWCRMLGSYDRSDPYPTARSGWSPIAPNGWGGYLRAGTFKVFIGITDDSPNRPNDQARRCNNMRGTDGLVGSNDQTGATNFDTALRTLAPSHFGPLSGMRNYVWYSIVGMQGNATSNPTPLTPTDPVVTTCCNAAGGVGSCGGDGAPPGDGAAPGQGYQYLSVMTGGLRYPSCYNSNFNAIFNAIAQGVIDRATASCEYAVPSTGNGIIDPAQTKVSYRMGGVGAGTQLDRVASDAACGAGASFYFSQDLSKIFLCPSTCTTVQADPMARIAIDFGCLGS
jgi:hypothetical protein